MKRISGPVSGMKILLAATLLLAGGGCEQPQPGIVSAASKSVKETAKEALPETEKCARFELKQGKTILPSNIAVLFALKDCQGEPVPNLKTEDFEIRENDKTISHFELSPAILPRATGFAMQTVLLLNLSGSVSRSGNLGALQAAARNFINQVAAEQKIAIYGFDGSPNVFLLQDFTDSKAALATAIEGLSGHKPQDPSANLNGAVIQALEALDASLQKAEAPVPDGTLVLFTDSGDQASRVDGKKVTDAVIATRHTVMAIGLGPEAGSDEVRRLGKDAFLTARDGTGLADAFSRVTTKILNRSQSFYVLAYCSPKRAGSHALKMSVRDMGSSFLKLDFSAESFEGGCDPQKIGMANLTDQAQ